MKVSIVIPVYNVEDYIDECIESVLNQNYSNVEIIIVNDGSKDASGEKCKRYISENFIYIEQSNAGLSVARNVGVECATGDALMFLDSDDYLLPGVVSKMVHDLKVNEVDILITGYSTKISNKILNTYTPSYEILSGKNTTLELLKCKVPHVAWGKLYKRRIFNKIFFPPGKTCEDLCEITMAVLRAEKVCFVSYPSLVYRRREGSIMHTYNPKLFKDGYSVYNNLEDRLKLENDTFKYEEQLATKYLYIMISNINLALRARDMESVLKICSVLDINKKGLFLPTKYKVAYFLIKNTPKLYFLLNNVLINNIKYRILKVGK